MAPDGRSVGQHQGPSAQGVGGWQAGHLFTVQRAVGFHAVATGVEVPAGTDTGGEQPLQQRIAAGPGSLSRHR